MSAHAALSEATIAEMLRHVSAGSARGAWRATISAVASACAENGLGDAVAARLLESWDPPYPGVHYAREIENLRGQYFCTAGWLVAVALANGFTFPKKERAAGDAKNDAPEKTVKFQLLEALPKFCASGNGVLWRARGEKVDFSLWTKSINDVPELQSEQLSAAWFSVRGKISSKIDNRGGKRWTVFATGPVEKI